MLLQDDHFLSAIQNENQHLIDRSTKTVLFSCTVCEIEFHQLQLGKPSHRRR